MTVAKRQAAKPNIYHRLGSIHTMTPIRVIRIAAGVTLILAVGSLIMNGWSVYMLQHMIATMKESSDDLVTLKSYQSYSLRGVAWSFVIALCQTAIIFYASRISKQNHAAS